MIVLKEYVGSMVRLMMFWWQQVLYDMSYNRQWGVCWLQQVVVCLYATVFFGEK